MVPLTEEQIEAVIARHAPIVRFHPGERYLMSSVEYFLEHATLHGEDGQEIPHPSMADLPIGDAGPDAYWFTVEEAGLPGDMASAKAYVHVHADDDHAFTDLQFWLFYPYNGPGTAHINDLAFDTIVRSGNVDLAPMGEHYGDWECCILRVDNESQTLLGVYLTQHAGGAWLTPDQFEHQDEQIIIYSSKNGHALYPSVSSNYTEHHKYSAFVAGIEFFLRNDTEAGAVTLDCGAVHEIVSAPWMKDAEPRWVNYMYRWGPKDDPTHLDPGVVERVLDVAIGVFTDLLATWMVEELVEAILPAFVTDNRSGPAAPRTKDTWTTFFDQSEHVMSLRRTVASDSGSLTLRIEIDGALESPMTAARDGGASGIFLEKRPVEWEFTAADADSPASGIIMSHKGLYCALGPDGLGSSEPSLIASADRSDALVLVPEVEVTDGDVTFSLKEASGSRSVRVDAQTKQLVLAASREGTLTRPSRFVLTTDGHAVR